MTTRQVILCSHENEPRSLIQSLESLLDAIKHTLRIFSIRICSGRICLDPSHSWNPNASCLSCNRAPTQRTTPQHHNNPTTCSVHKHALMPIQHCCMSMQALNDATRHKQQYIQIEHWLFQGYNTAVGTRCQELHAASTRKWHAKQMDRVIHDCDRQ